MEALGRVFNTIAVADGVYVPMRNCEAVSFICFLAAGDTFTLVEAKDAAGTSSQNLAIIDQSYGSNGIGGAWTKVTQTAAATLVISTHDCHVFTIDAASLSDTYTHIKVTSTGAGTVVAVQHDLISQRTPANLAALV